MRLAHGMIFRYRSRSVIAYWHGQAICGTNAREVLSDVQISGAFRHRAADKLIRLGVHLLDAADFACKPYKHLPRRTSS